MAPKTLLIYSSTFSLVYDHCSRQIQNIKLLNSRTSRLFLIFSGQLDHVASRHRAFHLTIALLLLLLAAAMTKQRINKSRPRLHSKELPTLGDYICPADEYVERLYQEQAKLMANPPEFLCRPTDCGLRASTTKMNIK